MRFHPDPCGSSEGGKQQSFVLWFGSESSGCSAPPRAAKVAHMGLDSLRESVAVGGVDFQLSAALIRGLEVIGPAKRRATHLCSSCLVVAGRLMMRTQEKTTVIK